MTTTTFSNTLEQPIIKKGKSPFQLALRRFLRNKMAIFGIFFLIFVICISVGAPFITHIDPGKADLYHTDAKPNSTHLLGTDDSGQDAFSRLLYGGRVSLLIGLTAMLITVVIGGTLGALAGYFGGWLDMVIMRVTDITLTLPFITFIMFMEAVLSQKGIGALIFAITVIGWGPTARLIRSEFLSIREREFVLSARAIGVSDVRIIIKHILPNALATLIVNATLLMAGYITLEASLSFLGFGVPNTTPTWGNMLNVAQDIIVLQAYPWLWIPPGVMIVLTVLSINFIGDGLRDAFDTKSTRR